MITLTAGADGMMVQGNALALPLADGTVQCCVTSPPYWGLRDYGVPGQIGLEATPDAYVANMVAVFREVRRVLRDDGTLWLNLGDSYSGNANSGGANQNDGGPAVRVTGLTPKRGDGIKPKDLVGIPWRVAFALQADGWYLRSDIIWSKPNPMPESVTDRPTKAHEYLFLLTKNARYYYDAAAIAEASQETVAGGDCDDGGPKYQALHGNGNKLGRGHKTGTRNKRSVWTINTQPYAEAHFATFPEKLVEPCILAGSKPGDLVLDPFAGSGTVGVVCRRFARRFVGVELNPAYVGMAVRRLRETQPGLALENNQAELIRVDGLTADLF